MISRLKERFRERTSREWLGALSEAQVPSAPINTLDRVLEDQQVAAREMIVEFDHPKCGIQKTVGNPIKVENVPEDFSPPPLLGEHTDRLLKEILKYPDDRIEDLRKKGAI